MGYYMRFIVADNRKINLSMLETALNEIDAAYTLQRDQVEDIADLLYSGQRYAQIEINHPDEEIFEDDMTEFKDLVGEDDDPNTRFVLDILENATMLIAVEAFWENGMASDTLSKLDTLWDWLFANRRGMLQADSEGFYNASGLILERKFIL